MIVFAIFESGNILSTFLLPLFGLVQNELVTGTATILRNNEAFGEYMVIIFYLFFPFVLYTELRRLFRFKIVNIFLFLLLIIGGLFLAGSRSAIILMVLGIVINMMIFLSFGSLNSFYKTFYSIIVVTALIIIFSSTLSTAFDTKRLFGRFDALDKITSISEITTGSGINREARFSFALQRISEKSWFIGRGYANYGLRERLLSGGDLGVENDNDYYYYHYGQFHSLYFSILILYGWFGSVSLILIFLVVLLSSLRMPYKPLYYRSFAASFGLIIILFLINQYKIDFIRYENYHLLIWCYLGFFINFIDSTNPFSLQKINI